MNPSTASVHLSIKMFSNSVDAEVIKNIKIYDPDNSGAVTYIEMLSGFWRDDSEPWAEVELVVDVTGLDSRTESKETTVVLNHFIGHVHWTYIDDIHVAVWDTQTHRQTLAQQTYI